MIDKYINKVIQGDCIDVMKELPDKCVDLVLTDPPYGIGAVTYKRMKSRSQLAEAGNYDKFDWNDKIPEKVYFDEMIRISKNQIIWGGNYFVEYLFNGPCWLVWDKDNGKNDFADCELAWTSFKTAVRIYKYRWQGMLQGNMKNKEKHYHPTQKPLPLIEWCLDKYSKEGDVIFDGFSGSGTTGVGCVKMNRKFILADRELAYCEIARQRIEQEKNQLKLF